MRRRGPRNKIVYRSLTLAFLFLVATLTMSAEWGSLPEDGGVPAYNAGPPPKGTKLPPILPQSDLWGADAQNVYQRHAYELAAKIPNVLHQQPCYCYCDRMGHNSLHSCFESAHGAQCATCLKDVVLVVSCDQARSKKQEGRPDCFRSILGTARQLDLDPLFE